MRVALINNMNNNFFAFARYLRDLGVDAHLFIIDPLAKQFYPSADTFEDERSLSYIHYLDGEAMRQWNLLRIFKFFKQLKRLFKELKKFDIIVGCGNLSYFAFNRINIDVFMPYAADIFQLTIQHKLSNRKGVIYLYHRLIAYLQCKAIKNSRVVMALASIDGNVNQALKWLGKEWLEATVPMVYPLEFSSTCETWQFLNEHDFVFFSHTRQSWYQVEDYKGNEKYIRAYARFIRTTTRYKKPILVLFEYGETIPESKALIKELNIEQFVKWMPKLPRKEIFYGLSKADLVVDALTDKVASFGGVVFEAFVCEKPVIGTAKIAGTHAIQTELPIAHAFTEDEVYAILIDYQENAEKYKKLGKEACKWFHTNIGLQHATRCKKLFELLITEPQLRRDSPEFNHELEKFWY